MDTKMLNVRELAKFLDKSESYVYKKVASNSVPYYKWEGSLYFDPNEVVERIKREGENEPARTKNESAAYSN